MPPWELTDAIDKGDIAARARAAAPDDRAAATGTRCRSWPRSTATTRGCCASTAPTPATRRRRPQLLGLKGSTFPARKALTAGAAGSAPAASQRAIGLLAEADLDLRGAQAWPDELVMEVLVARLARLGPRPWRR